MSVLLCIAITDDIEFDLDDKRQELFSFDRGRTTTPLKFRLVGQKIVRLKKVGRTSTRNVTIRFGQYQFKLHNFVRSLRKYLFLKSFSRNVYKKNSDNT